MLYAEIMFSWWAYCVSNMLKPPTMFDNILANEQFHTIKDQIGILRKRVDTGEDARIRHGIV